MLTRPDKFLQHQRRIGHFEATIVKIVSGATTYLIGDMNGHLTDGPVYKLLKSWSINHSVDWTTNNVPPGSADFTFDNGRFNPYGAATRLSELWQTLTMATVTVYLGAGPITALSDCMIAFIGVVSDAPTFSETTLTFRAQDPSSYIHKTLPSTLVQTAYPSCPRANRTDKIPIIYGDFTLTGDSGEKIVNGGLAPAVRVAANKFCLSDHELVSADGVWAWIDALNMAVELKYTPADPTNDAIVSILADDSDRGTATIRMDGLGPAYAYLYPGAEYDTADADQNDATDPLNAAADDDVYAEIAASGDNLTLFFIDDFGPGERGDLMDNSIGYISAVALQVRNEIESGATFSKGTKYAKSADGSDSTSMTIGADKNTWQTLTPLGTNTKWVTASQGIYWALARGNEDSNGPVKVACTATGTPGASGLVRIYCVRIRVYFIYQPGIVEKVFSECRGRKFGSWIDNAGHSNDYDEGDLIEHPNYIVESILIDELGIAEAAIDHASFDAAHNENLTMRLALHTDEQRSSDEIIKEIGLQGMFALYYSPAGTWKLISWDKEYITSRTIIAGPDITVESIGTTSWDDIINKLII